MVSKHRKAFYMYEVPEKYFLKANRTSEMFLPATLEAGPRGFGSSKVVPRHSPGPTPGVPPVGLPAPTSAALQQGLGVGVPPVNGGTHLRTHFRGGAGPLRVDRGQTDILFWKVSNPVCALAQMEMLLVFRSFFLFWKKLSGCSDCRTTIELP